MYPEKIERSKKSYICYVEEVFANPLKQASGFIMRNYSKELHKQEFVEINIITSGSGMHYIGNKRIPAETGDVFIVPPNIEHGYVGGDGFDVYHIIFSNKFFEKNMADLQVLPSFFVLFKAEPLTRSNNSTPLHLTLSESDFNEIIPLLTELEKATSKKTTASFIACKSLALALIAILCELYSEKHTEKVDSPHDALFMNTLALIHEKYNEKLTIDELAKLSMLSRSSFIRKFNDVCQTSPAKYINEVRITAAKQLLNSTSFSLSEIASKTGFYDTAHFIKAFSASVGTSPLKYRDDAPIAKAFKK